MNPNEYQSLYELIEAFPDEESCIKHLESIRWPHGIVCPWCGVMERAYQTKRRVYRCADCHKDFSVRKGTIFEESRLPLRKWFMASWLVTSHRKGIPSTQLARELKVTQKTAWFMLGRLREVMSQMNDHGGPVDGIVEADETYLGGRERNRHRSKKQNLGRGPVGKHAVAGARSRGGKVKVQKVLDTTGSTLQKFVCTNVVPGATLYTDEHISYRGLSRIYHHESVKHSVGEYVRGQAHTNSMESFWSLLKRGYIGTFHHFTWKHLHRYLDEFSARFNLTGLHGGQRLNATLGAASDLRLTYSDLIA